MWDGSFAAILFLPPLSKKTHKCFAVCENVPNFAPHFV